MAFEVSEVLVVWKYMFISCNSPLEYIKKLWSGLNPVFFSPLSKREQPTTQNINT